MVLPRENKIIPETAQHAFSRELFFQCISFCISFPLNPAGWGSGGEGGVLFFPLDFNLSCIICLLIFSLPLLHEPFFFLSKFPAQVYHLFPLIQVYLSASPPYPFNSTGHFFLCCHSSQEIAVDTMAFCGLWHELFIVVLNGFLTSHETGKELGNLSYNLTNVVAPSMREIWPLYLQSDYKSISTRISGFQTMELLDWIKIICSVPLLQMAKTKLNM